MAPREWDAWRVYWRARPREDVLTAAAVVCAGVERTMLGGDPEIGAFYPEVERARKGRRAEADQAASAMDRAFGV
jgi:hypothetical protein